jgi:hypothetical protein
VPRTSHALKECVDRARRADLADEIDVPDVDAQLERCRRDQRLQLAALEPKLRIQSQLLRKASVVSRHVLLADALGQMPCQALGEPPRVHEDERGPMLADELREPVVDLQPHFARHHGLEWRTGNFYREIPVPYVTAVDDHAVGRRRVDCNVLRSGALSHRRR